jgi:hypothetical protein
VELGLGRDLAACREPFQQILIDGDGFLQVSADFFFVKGGLVELFGALLVGARQGQG